MARAIAPPEKPKGRDYGYGNARVRGMKARLLDVAFYEQLLDSADMNQVITALSGTEYGPDIEAEVLHGRTATRVDEGLKENMARTFRKVMDFLDGEAQYIMSTLLGRWDVFNLKTIVRGCHLSMSREEIVDSLLPVGHMSDVELDPLAASGDVRTLIDTLVTWRHPYAAPLREAMPSYLGEGDIASLELALDRYYATWAHRRLAGRNSNMAVARRILEYQIDSTNLMTGMRLQKADVEDIEVSRFYLEGGWAVSEKLFTALATMSDIDELLDAVKGTPYGKTLEEAAPRYVETGTIAVFERALEDYVMRKALATGVGDPLGIGVVISYLWGKQNEVQNLRIIVKGVSVGMPKDRVRRELILV
ncbi:MAG: V-type ATP synthase subunit C [Coriobacteriia bacterium]